MAGIPRTGPKLRLDVVRRSDVIGADVGYCCARASRGGSPVIGETQGTERQRRRLCFGVGRGMAGLDGVVFAMSLRLAPAREVLLAEPGLIWWVPLARGYRRRLAIRRARRGRASPRTRSSPPARRARARSWS